MNKLSDIFFFVLVFILQLVLSDYVHLGPYVFLCLIPFLLVNIPLSRSPHVTLLIAFALGLGVDVLSDGVPGLNAFAAVLAVAPRKFFYRLLVNADRQDKTEVPLPRIVGLAKYLKYLGVLTAIYLIGYIGLDCISFRPAGFILLKFLASWAASMVLALLLTLPLQNRKLT
ncbi:MAG: hypothetical protein II665_03545 [Bacteroidales bacterium]|nr:hypothetical protein [Bacteroidales bacterium]